MTQVPPLGLVPESELVDGDGDGDVEVELEDSEELELELEDSLEVLFAASFTLSGAAP